MNLVARCFDPDYKLPRKPHLIALHIYANQDLAFGFSRAKNQPAGYRLECLAATLRPPHAVDHILEVRRADGKTIRGLNSDRFNCAIRVRN